MEAEDIRKYDRLKNKFFREHSEKYTWMDECLEADFSKLAHKLQEIKKPALEFFEHIFEEIMRGDIGEEEGFKKLEDYLMHFFPLLESYEAMNEQLNQLGKIIGGKEELGIAPAKSPSPRLTNKEFRRKIMAVAEAYIKKGAGLGYGNLSHIIELPSTSSAKKHFASHVKLTQDAREQYSKVNGENKFPSAQIIHSTLWQQLEINSELVPVEILRNINEYEDFALEQVRKFLKRSDIQKLLS